MMQSPSVWRARQDLLTKLQPPPRWLAAGFPTRREDALVLDTGSSVQLLLDRVSYIGEDRVHAVERAEATDHVEITALRDGKEGVTPKRDLFC